MAGVDYKSGVGYQFLIDLDQLQEVPTETSDFQEANTTEVSNSLGEAVDTFWRLQDEGYATNVNTALDPEYSLTLKFAEDDELAIKLLELRYSVDRKIVCKIIDNHTSQVIDFDGEATEISDARNVDGGVTEITLVVKQRGTPIIT